MKKMLVLLTAVSLLLSMAISPVMAGEDYGFVKKIKIVIGKKEATINGKAASLDQAAFLKAGRTLIPFRFLGENLGAKVDWVESSKTVKVTLGAKEVRVIVGSKTATVDGKKVTLDVPAEIRGGRTFIPLRFVSEALGAFVDYNASLRLVTVSKVDISGWDEYSGDFDFNYPMYWSVGDGSGDVYMTTPKGSVLTMWRQTLPLSDLLDYHRSYLEREGYEGLSITLIDGHNPSLGSVINATLKSGMAVSDDKIIRIVIQELDGVRLIARQETTRQAYEDDVPVFEAILNSIE